VTFAIKDLVGLSKPLERLIDVVAAGIGRVTKAHFVKKDAEAKAYEIRAIAQAMVDSRGLIGNAAYDDGKVKVADAGGERSATPLDDGQLATRALERQTFKELTQQQNTETIVTNAAEELSGDEFVPDESPEPEWISRFFRIAEEIPTEELQYLWGRILAGEIRRPGSFSLRTLELLRNLSKKEAETFVKLAPYVVNAGDNYFYLREPEYVFGKNGKLSFAEILTLKEAGLINSDNFLTVTFGEIKAGTAQWILNGPIGLKFVATSDRRATNLQVGLLTAAGIQLLKLVKLEPNFEYLKLLALQFHAEGITVYTANVQMLHGNQFTFSNETLLPLA
jgi:hypothetical protein